MTLLLQKHRTIGLHEEKSFVNIIVNHKNYWEYRIIISENLFHGIWNIIGNKIKYTNKTKGDKVQMGESFSNVIEFLGMWQSTDGTMRHRCVCVILSSLTTQTIAKEGITTIESTKYIKLQIQSPHYNSTTYIPWSKNRIIKANRLGWSWIYSRNSKRSTFCKSSV
jgi:hypothetical protein